LHRCCNVFRRHQNGKVRVGAWDHWENRGVDHSQTLDAFDDATLFCRVTHRKARIIAACASMTYACGAP
jgi:hypothetical protein